MHLQVMKYLCVSGAWEENTVCDPGLAGDDQHVCKWSIVFNQLMEGNNNACMLAHRSGCRKIAAFAFMDIITHKRALLGSPFANPGYGLLHHSPSENTNCWHIYRSYLTGDMVAYTISDFTFFNLPQPFIFFFLIY